MNSQMVIPVPMFYSMLYKVHEMEVHQVEYRRKTSKDVHTINSSQLAKLLGSHTCEADLSISISSTSGIDPIYIVVQIHVSLMHIQPLQLMGQSKSRNTKITKVTYEANPPRSSVYSRTRPTGTDSLARSH